jgi:putative nucleotidyltransferase with HDIG domain
MSLAVSELSQVFARQIAAKKLNLPAMPGTAAEVMALCQQDDTDAAKLSSVIHNDQTIASNVLRVANSAAYVGTVPCATLQQAVSRLGLQLITEIAMAVSVRGRVFGNPKCAALLAALWKHSVLTAYFTKEIARMHRRNAETAFLCGLLHDVGKAVLLDNIDRLVGKRELKIPEADMLAAIAEQHVAGGQMLSSEWKLPDQVAEAIAHHHDYDGAAHFRDLAMTVFLADKISHLVAPSVFAPPLAADDVRALPVLADLNMYSDQVDELLAQSERALLVTEGLQ